MYLEDGVLMQNTVMVLEAHGESFVSIFRRIVNALARERGSHAWYMVRLYGEGDMPSAVGCNMNDVLETIDREGALELSWSALMRMSEVMSQVFDLVIVGHPPACLSAGNLPRDEGFEKLQDKYDIVVEAFDSSEWRIGGRDKHAVEAVAAALR